jgi:hypothetical protein
MEKAEDYPLFARNTQAKKGVTEIRAINTNASPVFLRGFR